MGELVLVELLVVDCGTTLAIKFLVAKVLLVDVNDLGETTLLDYCLSEFEVVVISILIVLIDFRLFKLI